MPLEADAPRWWDDPDLREVRRRIERRRERERATPKASSGPVAAVAVEERPPQRRGVREVRGVSRFVFVSPEASAPAPAPRVSRQRPRLPPVERLAPRPDMIAAWAVVLGVVLLFAALLTAHG